MSGIGAGRELIIHCSCICCMLQADIGTQSTRRIDNICRAALSRLVHLCFRQVTLVFTCGLPFYVDFMCPRLSLMLRMYALGRWT